MNKAEQIAIIKRMASAPLMYELEGYLDIERDPEDWPDGYDLVDALDDFTDREEGNKSLDRKILLNVRDIWIAMGWYREVSDKELTNTITTSGKAYSFLHKGKKYVFDRNAR